MGLFAEFAALLNLVTDQDEINRILIREGLKGHRVARLKGGDAFIRRRFGTGAVTRTLVGSSDGSRRWDTVGVHENVIAASWMALEDAVAYGLLGAEQD